MTSQPANAVEVRGLTTYYGATCIYEQLDLDVRRGEIMGIVGGTGSGKSTLLRSIIMLIRPTSGSIRLLGHSIADIDPQGARNLRERFGVMFQQGALFSSLTVLENVAFPLREHTELSKALIQRLSLLKITLVGLPVEAAQLYPKELSGGMIKRAALARALALDPELLFLDEPSTGLDPVSVNAFDDLIMQLKASLGLTIVMISHDVDSLWRTTDRVAFLGEKRIVRQGSMEELSRDEHPLVRAYFEGATRLTQGHR
ncbi:MAG: ATP-binding cassette domain-containing protein [Gammaproteobacteria bacterium]|nr:ATP-binding cassette domain-containing protein [Gammaproteobacteria bacterium]NIR84943.1 ATP-binding cassette domain-containing protein [Gammaproteobacteria bacterium]NIR91792.1 ATP-binding cassette domain-containing protein [Gammaproteobacteria bacterium]NIU05990.1 ATP-binding cassette domain-containing protein [Gammaproteobacteria bacterium]NIV53037.1 ATP-binding cassette domain-containing protein [Gammaproteobacteria bacterium]